MSIVNSIMGQAANQYAAPVNVEDLFSTDLWTGNAGTQSVNNGIDFTNKGGLLWFKQRTSGTNEHHWWLDTARTAQHTLSSNLTSAQINQTSYAPTLSSTGYDITNWTYSNDNGADYVGWSFRKQPKFFDMVIYKGNGSVQAIPHNLGSVPGMIITKRYDDTAGWGVYHRGFGATATGTLSGTNTWNTDTSFWGDTDPTSTHFTVGASAYTGQNNEDYIAYIFAHNDGDGGFGATNDQDIIKCGSYTGTGAAGNEINLGFEPQWIMFKRTNSASDWVIFDAMRGLTTGGSNGDKYIYPNNNNAEGGLEQIAVTPTGFITEGSWGEVNASGGNYIYMAIRRGPMATPTSATDVFKVDQGHGSNIPNFESGFPVDFGLLRQTSADHMKASARLTSGKYLETSSTASESSNSNYSFDYQDGWVGNAFGTSYYSWMWKRARGFFDIVTYTGTGSNRTISHNLGVAPKMMWIKRRNTTNNWKTFHASLGGTKSMELNSTTYGETNGSAIWNSTEPTASVFSLGTAADVNGSGSTYIAYLFGEVEGISKFGSYTGNGSTQTIDVGFNPRFILSKKAVNGNGHWYLFDTVRGIVAGNDSWLTLNTTDAENTSADTIDLVSNGFTVNDGNTNANSDGYIYYAIA